MSIGPCTPNPVTPGVVQFDPEAFRSAYPAFATVTDAALQQDFTLATTQLDNSCCSVVRDANTRATLLNLLTAHFAALLNGANGGPPSGLVGRIAQATQGSVNVAAEYSTTVTDDEAFYIQTQWGAAFWQLSAKYRSARYIPPARGPTNPWGTFGSPGFGGFF